jgi:hypothetical protein
MRDRVDHAAVEHRRQAAVELRIKTGLVGAVPVQQARGRAVERCGRPVSKGNGDLGPVRGPSVNSARSIKSRVVSRYLGALDFLALAVAQVKLGPARRFDQ